MRKLHSGAGTRRAVGVALRDDEVGNLEECIVDTLPTLGRRFEKRHVELRREPCALLCRDLALVFEVGLVADEDSLHRCVAVLVKLRDPILDMVEAVLIRDVVRDHYAHRCPVVRWCDGPETLLPSRVPDLELQLPAIALHLLPLEVDADGEDEIRIEPALAEAHEEGGFADCGVSQQQQLDEMVVVAGRHGTAATAPRAKRFAPYA
mmetsp:Transcript_55868/g.120833  ORF Transcript_55868/g.120833 Transcript_55868/m.120833 type:complete len:207 (+) Transcript_55868:91-711(+)